jgi:hypothetical protein
LGLKITATVSWFGPQNHVGFDLLVAPQTDGGRSARDTRRDLAACFVWKEVWLGFPTSQSGLKIGGGATMGGARGTIVEVASEAS